MSLVTATALKTMPANSAGIAVLGSATKWSYGTWVEMFPVTPVQIQIAGIELGTITSPASDIWRSIAIGIGPAGAEVSLGEYVFRQESNSLYEDRGFRFPCPISIPAGQRVAVRLRNETLGSQSTSVAVNYYKGLDSDHATGTGFNFLPAVNTGGGDPFTVILTGANSAWANSAYIELTSGLADEVTVGSLAFSCNSFGCVEYEVELATGAAGAEIPATVLRESTTDMGGPKASPLPALYKLPASTRLAARLRKTGTSTGTRSVAVNYYGPTTIGGIPDPTGGGNPGTGVDPTPGTSLCGITAPLTLWFELELDASTALWSRVMQPLNHPSSYTDHPGPKQPRILSIAPITKSLSDWSKRVVTSGTEIVVEDTDGVVRASIAANTLRNKIGHLFVTDDDSTRANLSPHREGAFLVQKWTFLDDLTVRFTLVDRVGAYATSFNLTKRLPVVLLDRATFSDLPIELVGRAAPWPYGILSDESAPPESGTVGVAPITYVGTYVMADGNPWYWGLVAGCATGGPISVFAHPGGIEPARVKMDISVYDTDVAFPGQGQWTTVTGVSTNYIVRNGRRWTVILFKPGSASGEAMKSGFVPAVCNLAGIEAVGDGTGAVITSIPRQLVHLLNNCVFQDPPGDANWPAIQTISGTSYSTISTSTFETVKTTSEDRIAGGYLGAFELGWDLNQLQSADWIARMLMSGDFDLYVNADGQVCASMEDPRLTAAKSFTAIADMAAGSFSDEKDWSKWANRLIWDHMKRLPPPASTALLYDQVVWLFANDVTNDGTYETAQREIEIFEYEDWIMRDFTLAMPDNVSDYKLARMKKAPGFVPFDVDLCGTDLRPGSVYNGTHFAGAVATTRKFRLMSMSTNLMTGRVTLLGHDLSDAKVP